MNASSSMHCIILLGGGGGGGGGGPIPSGSVDAMGGGLGSSAVAFGWVIHVNHMNTRTRCFNPLLSAPSDLLLTTASYSCQEVIGF